MEKRDRIPSASGLYITAGILDALQFLFSFVPVLGIFFTWGITAVGALILFSVLRLKGVNFSERMTAKLARILLPLLFQFFIGWIPLISIIPEFSLSTWLIVRITRREDREYNEEHKLV